MNPATPHPRHGRTRRTRHRPQTWPLPRRDRATRYRRLLVALAIGGAALLAASVLLIVLATVTT